MVKDDEYHKIYVRNGILIPNGVKIFASKNGMKYYLKNKETNKYIME